MFNNWETHSAKCSTAVLQRWFWIGTHMMINERSVGLNAIIQN